MKRMMLIIVIAAFFGMKPAAAQSFELSVEHEHTLRNCRGKLVITPEKIEYQTDHKPDARIWEYVEIRQITVVSPVELQLATYEDQKQMAGRDRIFKFRLLEGRITPEISSLLLEKATRPIATSVMPQSAGVPQFEVPVKHLHTFGGCSGTLKIYADRIVYESLTDARYWRYGDVQNFSQSERFRFEIVTFEDKIGGSKAYNFQLREELPVRAYDYVWAHVYPSKYRRDDRLVQPGDIQVTRSQRPATKP